jgi:hypothetical protein
MDKENLLEREEELVCNYDLLNNFPNEEVMEAKFNVMTAIQPKAYERDSFKPEEKTILKNDKNEDEVKEVPLINYIRWRNVNKYDNDMKDQKNNLALKESNARIVEWSDGSMQLIIGEEYFDIILSNMDNVRIGLKDSDNEMILINKPVKQRMLLTPSEYSSSVRKLEKVIDQDESNLKVKLAYSYYDKQSYNKDEYDNKFLKKKQKDDMRKISNEKFNRKRKRTHSDF